MGLFTDIFRPDKAKESQKALHDAKGLFTTLTAYRPAFTTWNGAIYESLIIRASIDARARHISKLKVETYGTANPSLQSKMKLAPNQWQTWSQFLYRVSTITDVYSNCIITPVFDEYMTITGYYPVLPTRCEVIEYKGEPWLRYKFSNGQVGAVEFKKCAIINKYQLKNDFFGEPNNALDETMKLLHIQREGIEEAVKNTANVRFIARLNNFSTASDLAKERERFTRENLSSDNGGFLLFPNTYTDIKQIDSKPYTVDADQMKLIYGNVQNYFGVNEDILQNKAIGDSWSAFYEGAVEPFAIQFSETMTKAMFSERERAQGSGVIATSNRLQFMSNNDKLTISSTMLDRGVMSINEIRDIWNLAPVEDGDRRIIRGEYYDATNKLEVTDEE